RLTRDPQPRRGETRPRRVEPHVGGRAVAERDRDAALVVAGDDAPDRLHHGVVLLFRSGPFRADPPFVPAKAGTQCHELSPSILGPRFRGDERSEWFHANKRYLIASSTFAAISGLVAISRATAACVSSPRVGSTSMLALVMSARNPGSRAVASKERRSASTRSPGTPGGAKIARAVADCSIMNSSMSLATGLSVSSVMVGALGNFATRCSAFTVRMLTSRVSTQCGAMPA